jgi:hypothetical protein
MKTRTKPLQNDLDDLWFLLFNILKRMTGLKEKYSSNFFSEKSTHSVVDESK